MENNISEREVYLLRGVNKRLQNKILRLEKRNKALKILEQERLNLFKSCKKINNKIIGMHEPFPLTDVLFGLIEASEFLLYVKSYDGHNYEEIQMYIKRAKEIVSFLQKNN